ncbi:MAG: hypothetical protein IPJ71_11595 [Bdellovibrionales bacterium]|nr:hypothetical protein [Bdellovibrionales bacterium]
MLVHTLLWGTIVGLIHFVIMGILYGNPMVDKIYKTAQQTEPGVRKWLSQKKYLITQFLGTQVEVYILTFAFFLFKPFVIGSLADAVLISLLFAAIRVYPRFWNMWIQSTYPSRLLKIEVVNGIISTMTIIITLELLS